MTGIFCRPTCAGSGYQSTEGMWMGFAVRFRKACTDPNYKAPKRSEEASDETEQGG